MWQTVKDSLPGGAAQGAGAGITRSAWVNRRGWVCWGRREWIGGRSARLKPVGRGGRAHTPAPGAAPGPAAGLVDPGVEGPDHAVDAVLQAAEDVVTDVGEEAGQPAGQPPGEVQDALTAVFDRLLCPVERGHERVPEQARNGGDESPDATW